MKRGKRSKLFNILYNLFCYKYTLGIPVATLNDSVADSINFIK